MASVGINDAKSVAAVGKIKIDPFHPWSFPVFKIDGDKAADGAGGLIHQAGGLSKIDVLCVLADLGNA